MILIDAIWLSIGNLPFLEFWEFFLKIPIIKHSGTFPIDICTFENKYINMNKTKIKGKYFISAYNTDRVISISCNLSDF